MAVLRERTRVNDASGFTGIHRTRCSHGIIIFHQGTAQPTHSPAKGDHPVRAAAIRAGMQRRHDLSQEILPGPRGALGWGRWLLPAASALSVSAESLLHFGRVAAEALGGSAAKWSISRMEIRAR